MDPKRELEAVVEAAINGATVLTVNTRASRFLLAECDRVLGKTGNAWKTPDILPFTTWIERTFLDAQIAGLTELVLLNRRQELSLWKKSVAESGSGAELFRPTSASGQAAEAWQLLNAYRIPLNSSFDLTTQAKAFRTWAKRYQQVSTRQSWTDRARVADELIAIVKTGRIALCQSIHIWRCGELTPQYEELVASLRSAGATVVPHETTESSLQHARRLECDDADAELRRAATYVLNVLREKSESRVGVVIPRLREQRSRADTIFTETLHPEFYAGESGPRAFEISLGGSLAGYPMVRTALLLLRFGVEELKFQELRELLMSPFLAGAEVESGERARLCRWLGEHAWEQISAQRLVKLLNPAKDTREAQQLAGIRIPRLRKVLGRTARPEGLPTRAGMSDWATDLGRLLRETGWPGGEEKALGSSNFQVYEKWLEMLSDLASLDLTQEPVTLREAVEEIVRAAAAQSFAPENRGARVQIVDVQEAAGSLFDHLWVCGLNDDAWPSRRGRSAFIPVQLLRAAKVPGSTPESQAEEGQKQLVQLLSSSPNVKLSYSSMEEERKLRMAPGIQGADVLKWDELALPAEPTWYQRIVAGTYEESKDVNAPPVTHAELLHRGTSLLEMQSACPFRAFAELRLGATRPEEPFAGIDQRRRGTLIEEVLRAFWLEARDSYTLQTLGADERRRMIEISVDMALRLQMSGAETPSEMALREIERERLVELASEWLVLEDLRAPFDQVRHQQDFEYDVAGIRLKGRIDRIDRSITQPGEVVIDYKSGAASNYRKSSWELPRPEAPQLPLYASYLRSQGKNVVGVAFGILATAKSEVEAVASSDEIFGCKSQLPKWAEPTMDEQIAAWTKEIERLVQEHVQGSAQVDPKEPPSKSSSPCTWCHLQAMCRVREAMVDDGDDDE